MLKIILIVLGIVIILFLSGLGFIHFIIISLKHTWTKLFSSFDEGDSVEYLIDKSLKFQCRDFILTDDEGNVLMNIDQYVKKEDIPAQIEKLKKELINMDTGKIAITLRAFVTLRYYIIFQFQDKRIIRKRIGTLN